MGKGKPKHYDSASAFPKPVAMPHKLTCQCGLCVGGKAVMDEMAKFGSSFEKLGDTLNDVMKTFVKAFISDDPNQGCEDPACIICSAAANIALAQAMHKKQLAEIQSGQLAKIAGESSIKPVIGQKISIGESTFEFNGTVWSPEAPSPEIDYITNHIHKDFPAFKKWIADGKSVHDWDELQKWANANGNKTFVVEPTFEAKISTDAVPYMPSDFSPKQPLFHGALAGDVLKVNIAGVIHTYTSNGALWFGDQLGEKYMSSIIGVPLNDFPLHMQDGHSFFHNSGKEFVFINGIFVHGEWPFAGKFIAPEVDHINDHPETFTHPISGTGMWGDGLEADKMALVLKQLDGMLAIKKIGVPQALYDWLVANDIKVEVLMGQGFVFKSPAGGVLASAGMKLEHIQKGMLGQLHGPLKTTMQQSIKLAIKGAMHATGHMPPLESTLDGLPEIAKKPGLFFASMQQFPKKIPNKPFKPISSDIFKSLSHADLASSAPGVSSEGVPHKAIAAMSGQMIKGHLFAKSDNLVKATLAAQEKPPAKAIVTTEQWPCADLKTLEIAMPVPLRVADKMYQAVQGTTGKNRYYVVACCEAFRVACHYTANSLSIRVEGPDFAAGALALAPIFKNVDPSSGYASMHFEVESDMIAAKALGAVLMGMGQPWETPLPDLAVIKGK